MTNSERQLTRIADALEELVELSRPKEVDVEKLMTEATQALRKTNPVFDMALGRVEQLQLKNGENDAA